MVLHKVHFLETLGLKPENLKTWWFVRKDLDTSFGQFHEFSCFFLQNHKPSLVKT